MSSKSQVSEIDTGSNVESSRQAKTGAQLMTERDMLQKLIDDKSVAAALQKGASARHAISALQTILHWMGFDRKLKWEQFGADGDYGRSTAAAVAEFARRNGSNANGERVSVALANKIVSRYDSLEELKQLAEDLDKKHVERKYVQGSPDRIRVAALQTLLNDLGFGKQLHWAKYGADGDYGRSTRAAVAAFGKRERIATDGAFVSARLGGRIVSRLGGFYGPAWRTPLRVPAPASRSLVVKSFAGNDNRQIVQVSDGLRRKRFRKFRRGLFTVGSQKPAVFVTSNVDMLRALKVSRSEINVMAAVAENEGNLDAINTWDNAFLSFGLFQWTAGTASAKGELPALLARIKADAPDVFERYYGQYGLDVTDVSAGRVRGYFSLDGRILRTAQEKEQLRQAPWAFYFWLAGQDPEVQAMEVKHALGRLDQFYDTRVNNRFRVSDLLTSEYGVGLILDNHVNRPAYIKGCLAQALRRSRLGNPKSWGTEEERKFIDVYIATRATFGRSPMTHAMKRARVTQKYLLSEIISDRRRSFKRVSPT